MVALSFFILLFLFPMRNFDKRAFAELKEFACPCHDLHPSLTGQQQDL
jgi:hypothetical protein